MKKKKTIVFTATVFTNPIHKNIENVCKVYGISNES